MQRPGYSLNHLADNILGRGNLISQEMIRNPYENSAYFISILYVFFKLFFSYFFLYFFSIFKTILKLFFTYFKPIILKQKIVKK